MMVWRLVSNFRASGGDAGACCKEFEHRLPLPAGKAVRPAGMPALGHGTAQAGLGALDEEIALEFSHRIDHVHGELARGAGEIDTAERQAVNPDAGFGEACHRGGDIHGVAPEAVELGDDQDISGLEPVGEPCEFRSLADGDTSRDGFGDDAVRLDPEA